MRRGIPFRRLAALAVGVGVVLLLAVLLAARHTGGPSIEGLLANGPPVTGTPGACDVDGVAVAYRTAYRSSSPPGYDLTDAVVEDVAWPSCSGAVLTVVVGDGTTPELARGQLTLSSSNVSVSGSSATATVPVRRVAAPSQPPDAEPITTVGVTLDGGTTPVPAGCEGAPFSAIFVGTNGDDTITGTKNKRDLIYSLEGADTVQAGQGDDCVVTGSDALGDTVQVGNGTNLVRTGPGADQVTAGNGKNAIYTGAGDDTITIGGGKGTVIDAGDGTDTCRIPKSAKQITVVSCEIRVVT